MNIPPRVALPLLESIHGDWKEVNYLLAEVTDTKKKNNIFSTNTRTASIDYFEIVPNLSY